MQRSRSRCQQYASYAIAEAAISGSACMKYFESDGLDIISHLCLFWSCVGCHCFGSRSDPATVEYCRENDAGSTEITATVAHCVASHSRVGKDGRFVRLKR